MIDKIATSVVAALAGMQDGATVMIGGFGTAGIPDALIDGLMHADGARVIDVVEGLSFDALQHDTAIPMTDACIPP